jgi:hypothetical protein
MKKAFYFLALLLSFNLSAQQLFTENFNYDIGSTLISNGWVQIGNTSTNPILVDSNALQYPGYFSSGLGKAAIIGSSGQDVYVEIGETVSANNVYVSFLLKPITTQTIGDYFFSFLPSNNNSNYYGRLHLKSASSGYYKIGLSKNSDNPVYAADSFQLNSVLLVAIKYSFVAGSNTNDTISLFTMKNNFPVTEPVPTIKLALSNVIDVINISRLALRQGNMTNAPTAKLGGVRMAKSWSELNTATILDQPKTVTNLKFTGRLQNSSQLNWVKPTTYVDSLFTTLVFMRKDTMASSFQIPSASALSYIASSDFNANGSVFEFDSLAKCVYNGDGSSIDIQNLEINKLYYFVSYIVRTDTAWYGKATFTSGRTALGAVNNLLMTPTSSTTITTTWTNPSNYQLGTHTTIVFMKEGSPIISVNPNAMVSSYLNSTTFTLGSKFQDDSLAYCVYRGTGLSTTTLNLKQGVAYHVLVFSVRTSDSVYSLPGTSSGFTALPAPYRNIGPLVKTNTSSGVIDSTGVRALLRGVVHGINFRGIGMQFVLRDATGGISIYSGIKTFGYNVEEGDSIEVSGMVSQLNGLAILGNLDTLIVLGKLARLDSFALVQSLGEHTENKPIAFSELSFLESVPTNWPIGTILARNEVTKDTVRIRIINNTGFNQTPAPKGSFAIKGIGLQTSVSNQAPFIFNGYTISPRNPSDIIMLNDSIGDFSIVSPSQNAILLMDGDSSGSFIFTNTVSKILRGKGTVNYELLIDEPNGDFNSPLIRLKADNNGLDTNTTLSYSTILQNLKELSKIGDSVVVRVALKATLNSEEKMTSNAITVTFVRGIWVGISGLVKTEPHFEIYPNPATDYVIVNTSQKIQSITLYNLMGQAIKRFDVEPKLDLQGFSKGAYLLELVTAKSKFTKKLVIE